MLRGRVNTAGLAVVERAALPSRPSPAGGHAGGRGPGSGGVAGRKAGGGVAAAGGLQAAAAEAFRVLLFCVYFAEVGLVARLPRIGEPACFRGKAVVGCAKTWLREVRATGCPAGTLLSLLLLSWLYAFYAFEYK
jgi:hypothetical protein